MTIVEELRTNRESGAKRLESEYKTGLMTLARRFCADVGDAEELVNRTFAAVVEGIDDYLEQSAFFAWMCQIMTNLHSLDVRRKSNGDIIYPGTVPDMADECAHEAIYRNLDAAIVRDAIGLLPADQREMLLLHYFMDMPAPKIAKFLTIPVGTVNSRLHYARKALAAKLGAKAEKMAKNAGVKAVMLALLLCGLAAVGAGIAAAVSGGASAPPAADSADPPDQLDSSDPSHPSNPSDQPDPSGMTGWAGLTGRTGNPVFSGDQNMNTSKTITRTAAIAAASMALATTAGLPTRASAASGELCYKPDSGQAAYPWDNLSWWFTGTDSGAPNATALPTASDNVLLYSSKNAVSSENGKPMTITSGVIAKTKNLTICTTNNSPDRIIGIEVQGGGAMETAGIAYIGAVRNNQAGGGALRVLSGGTWTAKKKFYLAYTGGNSSLYIADGGTFSALDNEFIVGNEGTGVVTNEGSLLVKDFFVGGSSGVGHVVNRGDLTVTNKFTIGRMSGSSGYLVHESGTLTKTTTKAPVIVGYSCAGVFEVKGEVSLPEKDRITLGDQSTGEGTLILCEGGSINNVTNVSIGASSSGSRGHLRMEGGTLTVQLPTSGYQLFVGGSTNSLGIQRAYGDISGHGTIARDNRGRSTRIKLYGQVVAEGGKLDLASIKTVGEKRVDANVCGTNGWYAVNGGLLLYPAAQDYVSADHVTIGDYVYRGGTGQSGDPMDITLVNSLQLRLYDANGNQVTDSYYNHAALYAADRNDIPGAVPGSAGHGDITLGVWRLGHFDKPGDDISATAVGFDKAWLRFRIDSNAIPDDVDWSQFKVRLYRWDGSAWKVVGTAVGNDMPYVETTARQPACSGVDADGWNIGWYAAALVRNGCFTIVIR